MPKEVLRQNHKISMSVVRRNLLGPGTIKQFAQKLSNAQFGRGLASGPIAPVTAAIFQKLVNDQSLNKTGLVEIAAKGEFKLDELTLCLQRLHSDGFIYSTRPSTWSQETYVFPSLTHHW